jgi:hypothetical protein
VLGIAILAALATAMYAGWSTFQDHRARAWAKGEVMATVTQIDISGQRRRAVIRDPDLLIYLNRRFAAPRVAATGGVVYTMKLSPQNTVPVEVIVMLGGDGHLSVLDPVVGDVAYGLATVDPVPMKMQALLEFLNLHDPPENHDRIY